MSKTITDNHDYEGIQLLGLQPKDRAPNDYLRMTAKVFNAFKPMSPDKTVSSYINGFETTIIRTDLDGENILEFGILKGSCFIDDQYIGFTDDIVFNFPISSIVTNVDYYLVLKYQYSTQCMYNPAIFDCIGVSQYDESNMLKIAKFKMDGFSLVTYPQNLDDLFIQNYTRLFRLISDKAVDLFTINSFQGDNISASKLYKNFSNPEYSTRSGDIVFLDIDGLYKPAKACNRKIDKAIGMYVYNPKSGAHTIITSGIIKFNENILLDDSNSILQNMEPGKSYYLLDSCTESNYAWENTQPYRQGKISSRFIPGNVRTGFAMDNSTFMLDIDFSGELQTANFLELTGLPQQFQDRFNVIYSYWMSTKEKDFRNNFKEELEILLQNASELEDEYNDLKRTAEINKVTKEDVYTNTTLSSEPNITIGKVTGPITPTRLKEIIKDKTQDINQNKAEEALKFAKIHFFVNYMDDFNNYLSSHINSINAFKTNLSSFKSRVHDGVIKFTDRFKFPNFSTTFDSMSLFTHDALPLISKVGNGSSSSFTYYDCPSSNKAPNASNASMISKSGNANQKTISGYRSQISSVNARRIASYTTTQSISENTVSGDTPGATIKSNIDVLISTLTSIVTQLTNVKNITNNMKSAVSSFNLSSINNFISLSGTASMNNFSKLLFDLLFVENTNNCSNLISNILGGAQYLNNTLFMSDNNLANLYTYMKTDIYSGYYIIKNLAQELEDIYNYINTMSGTVGNEEEALQYLLDAYQVYTNTRSSYIDRKYIAFKLYQEALKDFKYLEADIVDIVSDMAEFNIEIDNQNETIRLLNRDLIDLDSNIIDRMQQQQTVNSILYISDYERRIYNYTYLTIRIRLKQRMMEAVQVDYDIITDVLYQLKLQTIPNRTLIDRAEKNQNAFDKVLINITTELEGMIIEYNTLRREFGIDDPILISDINFNDHQLADPNLECFKMFKTF